MPMLMPIRSSSSRASFSACSSVTAANGPATRIASIVLRMLSAVGVASELTITETTASSWSTTSFILEAPDDVRDDRFGARPARAEWIDLLKYVRDALGLRPLVKQAWDHRLRQLGDRRIFGIVG